MEVLLDAVRYFLKFERKTFVAVAFFWMLYFKMYEVSVNKATRDGTILFFLVPRQKHFEKVNVSEFEEYLNIFPWPLS